MTNLCNNYKASWILVFALCFAANPKYSNNDEPLPEYPSANGLERIGDHGYPSNPMNDRATGYLLKGKVKNGIGNYGNYIDWDFHPAGLWGEFTIIIFVLSENAARSSASSRVNSGACNVTIFTDAPTIARHAVYES